jgi:hypothetical protein
VSPVVREANVYFLPPTPPAPDLPRARSLWVRVRARFRGDLWRVRFAFAGFRMALRRPRTPLFADDDAIAAFTEQRAELIERRPRATPAHIIDFGSARARLRPVTAAR